MGKVFEGLHTGLEHGCCSAENRNVAAVISLTLFLGRLKLKCSGFGVQSLVKGFLCEAENGPGIVTKHNVPPGQGGGTGVLNWSMVVPLQLFL